MNIDRHHKTLNRHSRPQTSNTKHRLQTMSPPQHKYFHVSWFEMGPIWTIRYFFRRYSSSCFARPIDFWGGKMSFDTIFIISALYDNNRFRVRFEWVTVYRITIIKKMWDEDRLRATCLRIDNIHCCENTAHWRNIWYGIHAKIFIPLSWRGSSFLNGPDSPDGSPTMGRCYQ